MAVSTTNAYSGPMYPNGVTTVFPFDFTAPTAAEVSVILRDSGGNEVVATGYTVTIGLGGGGSVVFDTPPAAGPELYAILDPHFTQELKFENGSAWIAEPVNEGYDRSAIRDQVLKREVDRGVKTPLGNPSLDLETSDLQDKDILQFSGGKLRRLDRGRFAGQFYAGGVGGEMIPASGTGNDAALRSDLAAAAEGKGASIVALREGVSTQAAFDTRSPRTLKSFGAVGDGVTDDSEAAWDAISASYGSRYAMADAWMPWNTSQEQYALPPGVYNAGELALPAGDLVVCAMVPGTVVIRIPDGAYFSEVVGLSDNVCFRNIRFVGGKGAYRAQNTGSNVRGLHEFSYCYFDNYTECAIQNSANDHPYLRVRDCMFGGRSGYPTIGIAWGGYLDLCDIRANLFLRNAYHIKLGGGVGGISGSYFVENNDFISLLGRDEANNILPPEQQTYTLADIWHVLVKAANGYGVNSGYGASLSYNKFGNENQVAGNERILFAPELQADIDAGKPRGAIMPDRTWTTTTPNADNPAAPYTHILSGLIIRGNRINSISPQTGPFMRSYVPELRAFTFADNKFTGGQHTYALEFMGARSPSYVNTDWDVEIGADGMTARGAPFQFAFSNYPVGPIRDPGGNMSHDPMALPSGGVSDDLSFQTIRDATLYANWSVTSAAKAAYADIYGAMQGAEVTLTSSGGGANSVLAVMPANKLAWVQMILSQGSSLPLSFVWVDVRNFTSGKIIARKRVPISASAVQVVFPFVTPDDGSADWQIRVWSDDYEAGARTSFRVERGYANVGKRPANIGHIRTFGSGLWNGGHIKTPAFAMFEDGTGRLRVKYGGAAPTSSTDGVILVQASIGTTEQRPTSGNYVGRPYFDTTSGKPIWWNGSAWVDAAGAAV